MKFTTELNGVGPTAEIPTSSIQPYHSRLCSDVDEISISVTRMNDSGANLVQISLGDLGHVSVPFL